MTKDFDAGELTLAPFSPKLDVVDKAHGVIVGCMDALPDLKKYIIAAHPPDKRGPTWSIQALLPPPARIPYWYVRAMHTNDSVNMIPKKENITMQIGNVKHVFTVQVLSNRRALTKGEELIKFLPESDKPQQLEIEPAKKKARKSN